MRNRQQLESILLSGDSNTAIVIGGYIGGDGKFWGLHAFNAVRVGNRVRYFDPQRNVERSPRYVDDRWDRLAAIFTESSEPPPGDDATPN